MSIHTLFKMFKNGSSLAPFSFIFILFKHFYKIKTIAFSRIRTQIHGEVGEPCKVSIGTLLTFNMDNTFGTWFLVGRPMT